MSVVEKTVFCEGKQTSLDYRLLNRLVGDIPGIAIRPAGGKFEFYTFAKGYFFPDEIQNQRYLVFRDRDFDIQPTPEIKLLDLTNRRGNVFAYSTHRSCIENYLLNADLIHRYWSEKYQEKIENPVSKWSYGDSPGIDQITQWIETSSRNIKDYQAVRWSLGDLLAGSAAREQLKTTWTGSSGTLPNSLALEDCKTSALELIENFRQAVNTVTPDNFETSLQTYQERFGDDNFWDQQQYLVWFHGKDIIKQMQRTENNYPSLKKRKGEDFLNWAVDELDFNQYPDLLTLKNKIESL